MKDFRDSLRCFTSTSWAINELNFTTTKKYVYINNKTLNKVVSDNYTPLIHSSYDGSKLLKKSGK